MAAKELPYKNKGDLTNGPISRHLIRLTVPMMWGLVAIITMQLANAYFVSQLGTTELAGMSFTFPVTMTISHLVFGLNIAISSVISRLIGEKKEGDAKRVMLHAFFLAFLASSIIALLSYAFLEPLFRLLGADEATLPTIRNYMPLWLLASTILSFPVTANSGMRAAGDALVPGASMVIMALINIALDPILIFGLFGFPALGVKGAAVATLIAYVVCLFISMYFIIFKRDLVARDGLHLDKFHDSVRRLIFIAIPAGITNVVTPLTNAFIVALLASYGAEAVAAYGIVTRIEAFALLVVISLALGMGPIIGQNWGAERYTRVHESINIAIRFNFLWSFFVAAILGIFAWQIAGVFSSDPAVIRYTVLFFWIVPFSYAFGNLVFGWGSSFNAMGLPQHAFFMIVAKALLTLAATYIGSRIFGVAGIFWAIALTNLGLGIVFHMISWRICLKYEEQNSAQTVLAE